MSSAIAAKSEQARSTCRNVKECLSSMHTFWQRTVDGSLAARPLTSVMPPEDTRCVLTDRGAHRPLNDLETYAHRKPKSLLQQRSWRRSKPVSRGDARPNDKIATAQLAPLSTKTRRGGYVFSVRPVNAEDGAAFRMERAAIREVNQCVMDALSPRAC